ncbi:MAG: hypothetical protein LUC22_00100, partial [Prevotella sp.]|nr:hypothetical protein [Prevotella sp.]
MKTTLIRRFQTYLRAYIVVAFAIFATGVCAQTELDDFNQTTTGNNALMRQGIRDSLSASNKEIPKGVRAWTVDRQFGDITRQSLDTITHLFQNSVYTQGLYGEYNTLGNLGSPRINRIFADRPKDNDDFFFTAPYDFFLHNPGEFLFTNTLSPYANLSY